MRVIIINATPREESSYRTARALAEMIAGDSGVIYEIFLPTNLPNFCVGCGSCIYEGEQYCPDAKYVGAIEAAMEDSQVFIFSTPTFCEHIPASLKNFFDHFYFRWTSHRPAHYMWRKQAIIVSTCSHSSTRGVRNDIKSSLQNWGIAKIHSLTFKTDTRNWEQVDKAKRIQLGARLEKLARKILKTIDAAPSLRSKYLFYKGRDFQKRKSLNKLDNEHWRRKGWFDDVIPWKSR